MRRRIGGYVDGCLRRNITSKWMHTGILSGGEFSAKEKLCDVVAEGREFNIICHALSSSAISQNIFL